MFVKLSNKKISSKPLVIFLVLLFFIVLFFIYVVIKNTSNKEQAIKEELNEELSITRNIDHALKIASDIDNSTRIKADDNSKQDVKKAFIKSTNANTNPQFLSSVGDKISHFDEENFYKNYIKYKENFNVLDRHPIEQKDELMDPLPIYKNEKAQKTQTFTKDKITNEKRKEDFYKALNSSTKVNLSSLNDVTDNKISNVNSQSQTSPFENQNRNQNEDTIKESQNTTLSSYDVFKRNDLVLSNQLESPKTPFALMQGTVIQAILLTGINSELPGQITAQITRDIADSIQGKYLLIPRGSKLLGQYSSNASFGATRVFLGFNRIIFPNGQSLNIGAVPGQSTDGYAGFDADVDNHYFKIISNCLLLSSITAATDTYQASHLDANGNLKRSSTGVNVLGNNVSNALSNLIEKHVNLSPTLNVKPGYTFTISLTQDIFFNSPYGVTKRDYFIN